MRREPTWIAVHTALIIHAMVVKQFGGRLGVRDLGMLESALSRARNAWSYGSPDLYELAAAYASGISQNHPFSDGNKRVAFVVSVAFLEMNGVSIGASEDEAAEVFYALAAGELTESQLADWFRKVCQ